MAMARFFGPAAIMVLKGVGRALLMLLAPIGLKIAAIGLVIAGIVYYWDEIVAAVGEAWEGIKEMGMGLKRVWIDLKDAASEWWEGLKKDFMDLPTAIATGVTKAASYALAKLKGLWTAFLKFIKRGKQTAGAVADYVGIPTHNLSDSSAFAQRGALSGGAPLVPKGGLGAGFGSMTKGLVPAAASGLTNFSGGLAMVGEKGPELVVLPQGSDVISNANVQRLASGTTDGTDEIARILAAATGSGKEQTINITLVLDGDVLARHTAKIASETITEMLEFA
jgi:hypothetical protein